MTDRYQQALAYVADPELNGEPFPVGLCKQRTRIAFDVDSDGSVDAAEAWSRTKHRIPLTLADWRPAILWWTGGSEGHGHVAFTDPTPGLIWTVDFPGTGRWNRCSKVRLEAAWPALTYVGASLDIDGVQVIAYPVTATPVLDREIEHLRVEIEKRKAGPVRRRWRAARQALLEARRIIRWRKS